MSCPSRRFADSRQLLGAPEATVGVARSTCELHGCTVKGVGYYLKGTICVGAAKRARWAMVCCWCVDADRFRQSGDRQSSDASGTLARPPRSTTCFNVGRPRQSFVGRCKVFRSHDHTRRRPSLVRRLDARRRRSHLLRFPRLRRARHRIPPFQKARPSSRTEIRRRNKLTVPPSRRVASLSQPVTPSCRIV